MMLPVMVAVEHLPVSLQKLIQNLNRLETLDPQVAQWCLQSADIQAQDLWYFGDFNYPRRCSFSQASIYRGESFEIQVRSWMPRDFTAIHALGSPVWEVVQSFGEGEYTQFHYDNDILTTAMISTLRQGTSVLIGPGSVRQIGNPTASPWMSLHLHIFQSVSRVDGGTRVFDLYNASIQQTDGSVSFGLPDSTIRSREVGLRGDRLTTLRHHRQLLMKIQKIQQSQDSDPLLHRQIERLTVEIDHLM